LIFIVIGSIAVIAAAIYIFLLAPGVLPETDGIWDASYAHRGLHSKDKSVPENSLAAFSLAADKGYGIELDIQLTAD